MENAPESCGTCRFFVRVPGDPDEVGMGECRHDPPQAGISEDDPLQGIWPYIEQEDWCGQFELKSPAAAPAPGN